MVRTRQPQRIQIFIRRQRHPAPAEIHKLQRVIQLMDLLQRGPIRLDRMKCSWHGVPGGREDVGLLSGGSGFARGYAEHASLLRSCVAAPRVARKGEAWCPSRNRA